MIADFPIDTPLSPKDFTARDKQIDTICNQITNKELLSTNLVGGPKTGRTSMLRYLSSSEARKKHAELTNFKIIYLAAEAMGQSMSPSDFWAGVLKDILQNCDTDEQRKVVDIAFERSKAAKIDYYDLQDVFDQFGKDKNPIILAVDDFDSLLNNNNFWPPNDFFHRVRSLGQRQPRGLAFLISTPRPLVDLWDSNKGASPFYNIFQSLSLGRLTDEDIQIIIGKWYSDLNIKYDAEVHEIITKVSDHHPCLVSFIASQCADMLQKTGKVDQMGLAKAIQDPSGPVVLLIQQMRENLGPSERRWWDTASKGDRELTRVQRQWLRKLWEYGLIAPGVL